MTNAEIPVGLKEMLQAFTVEVLRHKPDNLLEFAVQHFTNALEAQRKNNQQPKKLSFRSERRGVTFESKSDQAREKKEEEEEEEKKDSEFSHSVVDCLVHCF